MDKYHQSNPPTELKSVVMGRENSRKGAGDDSPCSPNRFAIYDNPETGDREWYRNGKMTAKVDRRLLERARDFRKWPNQPFTDEALEPWESGRIKGDATAILMENGKDDAPRRMSIDVPRLVRRLMDTVGTTDMEYPPFYNDVRDACLTLERLQQWKKEGMQVFDEWERVWVAAGSPGTLGQSKAEAVLNFIQANSQDMP